MKVRGHPLRPSRTSAATAAVIVGMLSLSLPAHASPADQPVPRSFDISSAAGNAAAATLASTLERRLGAATAGSYLDPATGRLVVTVTDAATAQSVRAAGAVPRFVTHSGTDLAAARAAMDRVARVAGTAFGIDPTTNQVVVEVDPSVSGPALARISSVVAALGGAARLEHLPGRFTAGFRPGNTATPETSSAVSGYASGGNRVFALRASGLPAREPCSIGFNVRSVPNGNPYEIPQYGFITAGGMADTGGPGGWGCGIILSRQDACICAAQWYGSSGGVRTNQHLAYTQSAIFGTGVNSDWAYAVYDPYLQNRPDITTGDVDLYNGTRQDIAPVPTADPSNPWGAGGAVYPVLNQVATRTGSGSGVRNGSTWFAHDGKVTGLLVQATVAGGPTGTITLFGLIQTNICAEPGDIGGPLFNGTNALGVLVVRNGDCTAGGTTLYQPADTVLSQIHAIVF